MIRVMIADDEVLVRIGLKAAVEWEANGFTVVDEASNGRDALEKVRGGNVDILLLDIKMPQLDGLEVMQAIRDEALPVKVIILSCHDDFQLVKEAMRLGAADYFLKLSLQPEKLLHTLRRIQADMELPEKHESFQPEELISLLQIYDDALFLDMVTKGCRLEKNETVVLLAQKDHTARTSDKYILSILADITNTHARGECVQLDKGLFAVVFNPKLVPVNKLASAMLSSAEKYAQCRLFIGYGVCQMIEHLPCAMESASRALDAKFILGYGHIYTDIEQREIPPFTQQQTNHLLSVVSHGCAEEVEKTLDLFEAEVRKPPYPSKLSIINRVHDFLFIFEKAIRDYGLRMEKASDFRYDAEKSETFSDLMTMLRTEAAACLHTIRENLLASRYHPEVLRAMAYIDTHYASEISLSMLADHVGLSKSHFSSLFKKETGEGVAARILRLRLETSKTLLETTSMTISEVVEQVGFTNIYYFSAAFKKKYGISPTEYKRVFHSTNKY